MISLLIGLLILALVLGLVWWVITLLPLPPVVANVAQVILVIFFVLALVDILLGYSGIGLFHGPYLR